MAGSFTILFSTGMPADRRSTICPPVISCPSDPFARPCVMSNRLILICPQVSPDVPRDR
ncbi:hypothetical protein H3T59_01555 [Commensalibacter sp. M0357]|uniref:hypothetical protein n=1 Tax=unclassified Commensalibacter TaxID=2630218 RepID=UPI0018DE83EE|nr:MULTISPECIES: hypothetical protein [unclassified Commensalibacter]MBI0074311.1 hypothetical protein [Commensalibacter sp. M0357]MBI0084152.1 hypothetical protein [Commensalibacter sp. M0355]